jgi:hypothetical protein
MLRAIAMTLSLAALPFGCKSDDGPEAYPTYQECFDDHTLTEMLPIEEAIVVCCLEHPIANVSPACGATKADCINYLTANLKQTSAGVGEVMNACQTYVDQKDLPK